MLTLMLMGAGAAALAAALMSGPASRDLPLASEAKIKAFPGAQGHGAASAGGRGGRVIAVTTLADSGPGSLRACIDHQGPRVCVFKVAGVIRFTQRPPIISNPFITIAGQTAPGGGIVLAHDGGRGGVTPLIIKNTHDVIIRHIRVRPDKRGEVRGGNDAITFENSYNIMIDHVSASWALDENINGHGDNDNVTISWSIFAEGIPKHDKCALLGSDPTKPQRISFIYNICAHNGDRNPDMNFTPRSCVDVINNIFYNARSQFAEVWESYGGTSANLVGNVFRAGPSTSAQAIGIDRQRIGSRGPGRLFLDDNVFDGSFERKAMDLDEIVIDEPICPLSVKPMPAQRAYDEVLRQAGAFRRDEIDRRIIAEVRDRTGHIRAQPGTIPAIASATPLPDSDADGMPDAWEQANGAQPGVSDPWEDADGNGVLNLDQYLDDAHRALLAAAG